MVEHPAAQQFTDDELWNWLNLPMPVHRSDVQRLMKARAWAKLADLHPAAEKAVQLIDKHLKELEQSELERRIAERKAVAAAVLKYSEGMYSLEDLIGDLHDIAGVEDWRDE